jgi:arylsulfatase A-like enzyme
MPTKIFQGSPSPPPHIIIPGTMRTLFFAISLGFAPFAAAAPRPDVILITVDDLNVWIGCMGGHPNVKNQNIDRLAANTIVCLLSDHGDHLGEKEISGKNTLWDISTHVPLILAGPFNQKLRTAD